MTTFTDRFGVSADIVDDPMTADPRPSLEALLETLAGHRHIFNDQEWVPFGAIECAFRDVRALASGLLDQLATERQARAALERIAVGLTELDWCIGYELTEADSRTLDNLRDQAFAFKVLEQP